MTSSEVVVTIIGFKSSISVAYSSVLSFKDKLSMELEICSMFKFWLKVIILLMRYTFFNGVILVVRVIVVALSNGVVSVGIGVAKENFET